MGRWKPDSVSKTCQRLAGEGKMENGKIENGKFKT
jgi:hypothetical protein